MLILLAVSCLIWIGILTAAFTLWIGAPVATGWIVACMLIAVLAIWFAVMLQELLQSTEMPDYFEPSERSTPGDRNIASVRRKRVMSRIPALLSESCGVRVPRSARLAAVRPAYERKSYQQAEGVSGNSNR